ncbi:MAG: hypothetical protein ACE5HS_17855 [bacterium]
MKSILLVSADFKASVQLVKKVRRYGLDGYWVNTGRECLEILESSELYAVLIDNSIIDINGVILLELVIKLKPKINLIFVNSKQKPKIESQARQAGIIYYTTDMRDQEITRVISELATKHPQQYKM